MKHDLIDEDAARETLPTEVERNYGMLTAGVIALVVVGMANLLDFVEAGFHKTPASGNIARKFPVGPRVVGFFSGPWRRDNRREST